MTKQHHISLNSQFTVLLNRIICFSVQFCDNSLLVLKMRFQVFFRQQKGTRVFQRQKDIDVVVIILFHLQNVVSVF